MENALPLALSANDLGSGLKEHILCGKCQHIVRTSKILWRRSRYKTRYAKTRWSKTVERFDHYASFSDLRQSGIDGCHLCSIIYDPFRTEKKGGLAYVLKIRFARIYPGITGMIEVVGEDGESLETVVSRRSNHYHQSGGTLTQSRTDSDEVIDLTRRWLRTCLENHGRCKVAVPDRQYFPKRILQVSMDNSGLSVRLRHREDISDRSAYMTLSHCWGDANILKLTKETLEPFSERIPLQRLPKSFLDAALVVVRLGYQYLWIDSVCILQDVEDDRDEEIRSMGEIYRNSLCTIAALGATNSHDGCFITRSPLTFNGCMLTSKGRTSHAYGFLRGLSYYIGGPDQSRPFRPPLHRRAWVVQERTLSPRTLYYGSQMVFWECVQSKASEVQPEMAHMWISTKDDGNGSSWELVQRSETGLKSNFAILLELCRSHGYPRWSLYWHTLVEEYTAADLSSDSDKWAAISGVAQQVERESRLSLWHGLWRDYLIDELLWHAKRSGRILQSMAPSWSWLSVNAAVQFSGPGKASSTAAILSTSSDCSGTNGSDQQSQITVHAPLSRFYWACEDGLEKNYYDIVGCDPQMSIAQWYPDSLPKESLGTWALQFKTDHDSQDHMTFYAGLVVTPVDELLTRWRRVGLYILGREDEKDGETQPAPPYYGEVKTITLI